MADCESCKNYDRPTICSTCENGSDFEEMVFTNADRIRAMNDEELYNLIEKVKMCGGLLRAEESSSECKGCKDGFCCNVLHWLKSEAE